MQLQEVPGLAGGDGVALDTRLPFGFGADPLCALPTLLLPSAHALGDLVDAPGGRPDRRLLLFALLSVPATAPLDGGTVYEWAPRLGELAALLWAPDVVPQLTPPADPALAVNHALTLLGRIYVVLPDGSVFAPAHALLIPRPGDRRGRARLRITPVPHTAWRPRVAAADLSREGALGDIAIDTWLRLCCLWEEAARRNGGARVCLDNPAAAGAAARLARPLDSHARRALVYGAAAHTERDVDIGIQQRRADMRLRAIENAGRVVIARRGDYWRCFEPASPASPEALRRA